MKILFTSLILFSLAVPVVNAETYKAPDVKLSVKALAPSKVQQEDWDSEYKVHDKPAKKRSVASEPDQGEDKVESMPMRYPSSVDDDGVHSIEQWKFKNDY